MEILLSLVRNPSIQLVYLNYTSLTLNTHFLLLSLSTLSTFNLYVNESSQMNLGLKLTPKSSPQIKILQDLILNSSYILILEFFPFHLLSTGKCSFSSYNFKNISKYPYNKTYYILALTFYLLL